MNKTLVIIMILGLFVLGALKTFESNRLVKDTFTKLNLKNLWSNFKFTPAQGKSVASVPDKQGKGEIVVLVFKNGKTMTGELIETTEDAYVINWKGEATTVYKQMVERVGDKSEIANVKRVLSDEEISQWWPYANDVVIRLSNRMVVDAKIERVDKDKITALTLIEGGRMEQDFERSKVEYLLFKPVANPLSQKIEGELKKKFPQMKSYQVGNCTIFTDSYVTWVDEYKKILKRTSTNIYFQFFGLLKDRKPQVQNYVVIFDHYLDFMEFAIEDGVPGWAVAGYFRPDDKVLYLFNALGDAFSQILFEVLVGESNRDINDFVEYVEGAVDERYHIFIEGQAKQIKDKFWEAYTYFKGIYRNVTESTLRHEFTHGIFHNWGLQNINISRMSQAEKERAKGKKDILEKGDYKEKARLIKMLATLDNEAVETQAANSWLAEGLATYCETDPIGGYNERWVFLYQEMAKQGGIYPLEALTGYKIGSFPGVCPEAQLHLYAQSWALVSFLMERYPEQFIQYQNRMTQEVAGASQDIAWLLEATGKDLRTLEGELGEYMQQFSVVEDPDVAGFLKLNDIFSAIY